jgi:hypothetical protein
MSRSGLQIQTSVSFHMIYMGNNDQELVSAFKLMSILTMPMEFEIAEYRKFPISEPVYRFASIISVAMGKLAGGQRIATLISGWEYCEVAVDRQS